MWQNPPRLTGICAGRLTPARTRAGTIDASAPPPAANRTPSVQHAANRHDDGGRPRIVITGLGAVSPVGVGVPSYIRALREGRSGVRRLDLPDRDAERIKSTVGAPCPAFNPHDVMAESEVRRLPRLVPMALAAAREAAAQAGLDPGADAGGARRIGVILGTGAGGIDFTLDQAKVAYGPNAGDGPPRSVSLWTITNATHGNLAGELSIHLGARGPSLCLSTGCASSSDAIGHAMDLLRSTRPGAPEAVIAVGADAHIRWETLKGMELLRCISTRDFSEGDAATASRPFDATRDGFVLGEGAWAVVLERERHAQERGARALGEAMGYAATCDAYHRVRPAPDMEEAARAITRALADARVAPEAVEVVHYHGTATQLNDALETSAIKRAFGEQHARALVGHSVKSMIGHPQGACGAASVVATLGALGALGGHGDGPFIPPTINLRAPDPACDLDYTANEARATDARLALVNCLAFGAKNSALVVRVGEEQVGGVGTGQPG